MQDLFTITVWQEEYQRRNQFVVRSLFVCILFFRQMCKPCWPVFSDFIFEAECDDNKAGNWFTGRHAQPRKGFQLGHYCWGLQVRYSARRIQRYFQASWLVYTVHLVVGTRRELRFFEFRTDIGVYQYRQCESNMGSVVSGRLREDDDVIYLEKAVI